MLATREPDSAGEGGDDRQRDQVRDIRGMFLSAEDRKRYATDGRQTARKISKVVGGRVSVRWRVDGGIVGNCNGNRQDERAMGGTIEGIRKWARTRPGGRSWGI